MVHDYNFQHSLSCSRTPLAILIVSATHITCETVWHTGLLKIKFYNEQAMNSDKGSPTFGWFNRTETWGLESERHAFNLIIALPLDQHVVPAVAVVASAKPYCRDRQRKERYINREHELRTNRYTITAALWLLFYFFIVLFLPLHFHRTVFFCFFFLISQQLHRASAISDECVNEWMYCVHCLQILLFIIISTL